MSVFNALFGDPASDNERLADRIMEHLAFSELGKTAADALYESDDERLSHENAQLDALLKRRSLGLPQDTGDLESAMNNGLSFRQKGVLAAFGSKSSSLIPDPTFLLPKPSGTIPPKFSPTFKWAKYLGGMHERPGISGVLKFFSRGRI